MQLVKALLVLAVIIEFVGPGNAGALLVGSAPAEATPVPTGNPAVSKSRQGKPQVVVQACKPSGENCTWPSECCSGGCAPGGFGGQPKCE